MIRLAVLALLTVLLLWFLRRALPWDKPPLANYEPEAGGWGWQDLEWWAA